MGKLWKELERDCPELVRAVDERFFNLMLMANIALAMSAASFVVLIVFFIFGRQS